MKYNRNLTKISNLNQLNANVFVGSSNIGRIFNDLSVTKHDLINFVVDVPLYDTKNGRVVIIVGGLFEESNGRNDDEPLMLGFSRTFLLSIVNSEIFIKNDQLSIRCATEAQVNAQKQNAKRIEKDDMEKFKDVMPTQEEQKIAKLILLQKLTECNEDYCRK
jgi:hypothetical protein